MKGCRRGCIAQLLLWAVIATTFSFYARSIGRAGPEIWPVSIGIGLVATMALLLAHSAVGTAKERRLLLRASEGVTPRDGEWTAVCGEIRSSAPMRAPLSGEPAVAYEYSIGRDQRIGKSTSFVTYFDGKALAASTIVMPTGVMRILAVPALEVEPAQLEEERAIANAREYVRQAEFAPRDSAQQRTAALEREWTDDDGVFRIDKKHSASDIDLSAGFRFEERHVKPGETVCAFGVYSAERRGLIPDAKWGRHARIMRGVATDATRALRARVIRYVIGSLILGALAVGVAIAYISPETKLDRAFLSDRRNGSGARRAERPNR